MGLEEYVCFKESIQRCPSVPWNMDPEHLRVIDATVKGLREEQIQKKQPHYSFWENFIAIRRQERKYSVLLMTAQEETYYHPATHDYDLALFHEAQLVDVLSLSSLACNAHRLKKNILSENQKEYEKSPYMELCRNEYVWQRSEIPFERRSIRELQETGVSIRGLGKNEHGIPYLCCANSEEDLRSEAFLIGGNHIVGYHRTLSLDKNFPFIHIAHRGYPVIINPTPNPQNTTAQPI